MNTQTQQAPHTASHTLWQSLYQRHNIADFHLPNNINNLIDLLQPSINKHSNQTALSMGQAKLTYAQLDRASRQFANFLQAQGFSKGTRIAVQLPNIMQYPAIILGCMRAGMILVNVNPLYTSHELAHQLSDSGAEVLVIFDMMRGAYDKLEDRVKAQLSMVIVCSMQVIEGLGNDISLMASSPETLESLQTLNTPLAIDDKQVNFSHILSSYAATDFNQVDVQLEDVAVFQYTGGTTGKAKGAMLTHQNLIANIIQCYSVFGDKLEAKTSSQVKVLNPLPLYHIFSFTVCGLLCIYGGWEDILITNPRDLNALIDSIEYNQPNVIPSVNTLFAGMLGHPKFATLNFDNLHLAIGGGTAIIADIAHKWQAVTGITINEGYGMSETSPVISFNPMGITEFNSTVGIPLPSTDIIIVDDNDNICNIGESGEVCVKGPQVMQGYWKVDNTTSFSKDGYFRTGDIGFIGTDGYVTLVDRKKDMILVSGFNVYPNEIEAVLTEHPKVFEVGVIGIADERSGEAPKAFIVKSDDSLTVEELDAFAREHLTGYKRPHVYTFIDELPKSAVGKILRKDLRTLS